MLRVDGGMRSGRDVLVTAALGGDEYGFGTVAMIATGCIMVRPWRASEQTLARKISNPIVPPQHASELAANE